MDKKSATFYDDAELFTQKLIHLIKNNMQLNTLRDGLTPLVENLIKIICLDVEDRFEFYDAPSGKKVIILFAKDTDQGYESAFFCDRFEHRGTSIDLFVLPNDSLLYRFKNSEILQVLDRFYAFILETKKASADYVSPIEIAKHIFARYYFKFKLYANAFVFNDKTVNAMKKDINEALDGMLSYDDIISVVKQDVGAEYFTDNLVLEKISSELYYQVIDELAESSGEVEEDEEYEEEEVEEA